MDVGVKQLMPNKLGIVPVLSDCTCEYLIQPARNRFGM